MNGEGRRPGTATRRVVLAAAATGTVAVATGLLTGWAEAALSTRGVDYSWGRPGPSALRAAGYTFACRYLSHDTTGKNLTQSEAQALIAAGVDIVSNWENSASAALNGRAQGVSDAQAAQSQALACGMPGDRPIYFSVDFDATEAQQTAINAYFDGIASVIGRARTGGYGGFYPIQRCFDAGKIAWGWQTSAWSGGQWDSRAQLRQVQYGITVGGAACDADEAWAPDFGQWGVRYANGAAMGVSGLVYQNILRFFGRRSDGQLIQYYYYGGRWVSQALGGSVVGRPGAVADRAGALWVFASGTDGVPVAYSYDPSQSQWSQQTLPGTITSGTGGVFYAGRVRFFARGSDGQLVQYYRSGDQWGTQALGGEIIGSPSAVVDGAGVLWVFVTGADGTPYAYWYDSGQGQWNRTRLFGTITSGTGAVAYGGSARFFARGVDGGLVQYYRSSGRWVSQALGGAILGCPGATMQGNQLQVFLLGSDGTPYLYTYSTQWTRTRLSGVLA